MSSSHLSKLGSDAGPAVSWNNFASSAVLFCFWSRCAAEVKRFCLSSNSNAISLSIASIFSSKVSICRSFVCASPILAQSSLSSILFLDVFSAYVSNDLIVVVRSYFCFNFFDRFGGPERIRTADLHNANVALYQLSYRPEFRSDYQKLVDRRGFEPLTSAMP